MGIGLVVLAVAVLAAGALLYNLLVAARLRVREAWASIDVQLQRRASLIPNLVEVVKGYAGFERETLERVISARGALGSAAGPASAAAANADLNGALGRLFAVAEAYPDLKADEQFGRLQGELSETENTIAFARNYYNGAVEAYNTRVQTLPGLLVAGPLGFTPAEFFAADAAARVPVSASLG
jgi:LemA protein